MDQGPSMPGWSAAHLGESTIPVPAMAVRERLNGPEDTLVQVAVTVIVGLLAEQGIADHSQIDRWLASAEAVLEDVTTETKD